MEINVMRSTEEILFLLNYENLQLIKTEKNSLNKIIIILKIIVKNCNKFNIFAFMTGCPQIVKYFTFFYWLI